MAKLELQTILDAIDSGDPNAYAALLTDDSIFRFGNWPASEGKPAIHKAQTDFFATIKGCKHKVLRTWADDKSYVADMEVT